MLVLVFDNFQIQQSDFHNQGHANEKTPSQACPRPTWGPLNEVEDARGQFQAYNHHGCQQESLISDQGLKPKMLGLRV